jgi:superfamily I DNA/RNA helicase
MASDRKEKMRYNGKVISQLFVCRSRRLCEAVKRFQNDYYNSPDVGADIAGDERFKNVNNAVFRTLDEFINRIDLVVSREKVPTIKQFQDYKWIGFEAFKTNFMEDYVLKHSILKKKKDLLVDPLIVWTQIRSFIKGSAECIRDGKYLDFEQYMEFDIDRCRLDNDNRQRVYVIFGWYQEYLEINGFWDDCDRVFDVLCRSEMDGNLSFAETDEKEAYDQVYVDEIQDSTQAEIVLFFLVSGLKYTNVFLAGDPAQSVVEGVDFRFEEVRGIVHMLTKDSKQIMKLNKPYKLITNYRSHGGILNCATAILNLMFELFPAAATRLNVDKGFCKGPRPIYFHDVIISIYYLD